jgi:glycosyltransferase involved in cell wall biosynthesis
MAEPGPRSLPLVTVVTPSLNQAAFIEDTIRSVLDQSYPALDYVIVDGGSTDGTLDILRRYEGRLRWVSEKDRGQTDAVNKGFRMARGQVLGWLNADDLYCPGAIREAARHFIEDSDVMMVYGAADDIDDQGRVLEQYPTEPFDFERLAYRCIICQPAVFMRKALVEYVGYLDAGLQCSMDLDLWIRCGLAQKENPRWKFVYDPRQWAHNRFHLQSKSLVLRKKHVEITAGMVRRHYGFLPFNWVYGLEELKSGEYDGILKKSPLSVSLVLRSLAKWSWMNRRHPGHMVQFLANILVSPLESWRLLKQRTTSP